MHKRIRLNAAALAGLLIILFFLIIAVFAPVIAPYDPKEMIASYLPPSREHLLGTNDVGQDIFSEMVYGTRVSLYIGIFAAFIVTGVGTVQRWYPVISEGWQTRSSQPSPISPAAVPSFR